VGCNPNSTIPANLKKLKGNQIQNPTETSQKP
jgi:hypothetical protein